MEVWLVALHQSIQGKLADQKNLKFLLDNLRARAIL